MPILYGPFHSTALPQRLPMQCPTNYFDKQRLTTINGAPIIIHIELTTGEQQWSRFWINTSPLTAAFLRRAIALG
jgi:hypothetical protein